MTLNCEKCDKEFKYKSGLAAHLNRKTPCVKSINTPRNVSLRDIANASEVKNTRTPPNQRGQTKTNTYNYDYNIQIPDTTDVNVVVASLEEQFKDINLGGEEAKNQIIEQIKNVFNNREYLYNLQMQQCRQYQQYHQRS